MEGRSRDGERANALKRKPLDKLTHLLYQEWETRGELTVELMLLLPGLEVCYRFIFPPRRRCKILSLVIFLLCISSQEGSSCSLKLSALTPPSIIPPHPRGGRRRRRCSEVRCCEILCAVRPSASVAALLSFAFVGFSC